MDNQVYLLLFGAFIILGIGILSEILTHILPARLQGREHRIAVMIVGLVVLAYIAYNLGFVDLSSISR